MHSFKKILKTFLGLPLTLIAFYFIFSQMYMQKSTVAHYVLNANPGYVGLGILFLLLFFLARSLMWVLVLKHIGYSVHSRRGMYYLTIAETKRYLPGLFFAFFSRLSNHEEFNIKKGDFVKAVFFEGSILVLSSLTISIPGISLLHKLILTWFNLGITYVIIASSLTIGAAVLFFLRKKISRDLIWEIKMLPKFVNAYIVMCAAWIFFGLGCFFIGASIASLNFQFILMVGSFFVLSWFIGYLSFITPTGLGVQEAVITAGLSLFVPPYLASAIALMTRVGIIISEICFITILRFSLNTKLPFSLSQYLKNR